MQEKTQFYDVDGVLTRRLAGRVMPDLYSRTKGRWVMDHDLEAFDQRAYPISIEEARKMAGGADLMGPTVNQGDNADDDRGIGLGEDQGEGTGAPDGSQPDATQEPPQA